MSDDRREPLYRHLHEGQLSRQDAQNKHSALAILAILSEYFQPASVLDVGCGLGAWLQAARELGVTDLIGAEGPWLDASKAAVDPACIRTLDLEAPFDLHRRFDLAICLEVAEHLAPAAAEGFVRSLTLHSDHVLFSAAIPYQVGHHHVNEQFLSYWIDLFAKEHFAPLDLFRARIWSDNSILWWLRQNIILFVHEEAVCRNEKLARERQINRPLSIVHPEVYLERLRQAETTQREFQQLVSILSEGGGGKFECAVGPNGKVLLRRL